MKKYVHKHFDALVATTSQQLVTKLKAEEIFMATDPSISCGTDVVYGMVKAINSKKKPWLRGDNFGASGDKPKFACFRGHFMAPKTETPFFNT